MKQFFLLIFLIKLSYVFSQAETNSTDIIEMTDKNYVRILNESEAVLVYFYSEESVKCKKMNEEIKKLNKYIQESKLDVILTKVDVAKEENVPVEMGVEEIPKLKFIRYKFKIKNDYEGKSNFQELKAFVDKKLSRKLYEIKSVNDILFTEENNPMTIFICGDKKKQIERFNVIEKKTMFYDLINVTWSDSNEVRKYLNCTKDFEIILMKNFDDRYTRYDKDFTEYYYEEWISYVTTPIVMDLTAEKLKIVFQENIPGLIFFSSNKSSPNYTIFYQNAKSFKVSYSFNQNDIFFFNTFNSNSHLIGKLQDKFQVTEGDIVLGINFFDSEFFKYRFEDFSQNFTEFVVKFIEGNATEFYKSEPIPNQEVKKNIIKLVGLNFLEKITEDTKDVLLFVDGNPCGICPNLLKRFKRFVEKMTGNDGIKFAKIDISRNEVKGYDFEDNFPRILLFSGEGNNRLTSSKVYTGNKFNLTELFDFVNKNSKNEVKESPNFSKEEESDPEEEDDLPNEQSNTVEEAVIDLSHRFDNMTTMNESQPIENESNIKNDL